MISFPTFFYRFGDAGIPEVPGGMRRAPALAGWFESQPESWKSAYLDLCEWADSAYRLAQEGLDPLAKKFPLFDAIQLEDGTLRIDFALAGYRKDDIQISFDEDVLRLSAEGAEDPDKTSEKSRVITKGIKTSKFSVSYQLASGRFNTGQAQARYQDGILTVTIPLAENRKPVKVSIE